MDALAIVERERAVVTDRDRSLVARIAVVGAVSAQDVMARFGVGRTVGYRRLRALVDHGRLIARAPRVGTAGAVRRDQGGAAVAGLSHVEPARVGVATTRHLALSARVAVVLERRERCEVWGEPRQCTPEHDADRA